MSRLAVYVVCGPSGSGKSTLLRRLLSEHRERVVFTVSHTTRPPRSGERDGREYHFVSRQQMESMIAGGEFIEHTQFSGSLYGTSRRAVESAARTGKLVLLEVDIEGAKALRARRGLSPVFVFIRAPSKERLAERLAGRATESPEAMRRRLERAAEELEFVERGPIRFELVLVNDQLEEAYAKLVAFLKLPTEAHPSCA